MVDTKSPLVRFAVVSDMHAFSSRENAEDSLLDYSGRHPAPANPLADLRDEVKRQKITVDFLICAGDICNRADSGGLFRAWGELQGLREDLQARQVIATCGNHDLDSRYLTNDADPDPKGALLSLTPAFPFDDVTLTDKFWARNYALLGDENVVIATLNTSAYHGGRQDEIQHGRVSRRTIDALGSELKSTRDALAHVLICHHHPLPLKGWGSGTDAEYVRNGQELLDELIRVTGKSWLVIHGHRHKPRLIHGASSSNAVPFVLGAGSLGARIPGVANQFHIVSIFPSSESDHSSITGIVETWSWTDSTSWNHAAPASGLPPICGFGYRGQIRALSKKIADLVGESFTPWSKIREELPAVDFLMPDSLIELEAELKTMDINILPRDGRPYQVGK